MTDNAGRTAILTDSTADIPVDQAETYAVTVVPAVLTVEGKSYIDGIGLTRADLYRRLPELREPPTTAAPSPLEFERAYARLLAAGYERILSMHLSSKLSGMVSIAAQAARKFGDRVRVFDSGQVSLGLGFQVIEAAGAALSNLPFDTILGAAQRARERVRLIAMINTLEYIRRSGRVSWLRANLGELLHIKILVELVDGVINRIDRVRTRHKALEELRGLVQSWGPLERVAVLHTAIPEEAATFAERLRQLSRTPPIVVDVTTIIGAHVGEGSIGVAALRR
jgi:DegV family protein with EDD domain